MNCVIRRKIILASPVIRPSEQARRGPRFSPQNYVPFSCLPCARGGVNQRLTEGLSPIKPVADTSIFHRNNLFSHGTARASPPPYIIMRDAEGVGPLQACAKEKSSPIRRAYMLHLLPLPSQGEAGEGGCGELSIIFNYNCKSSCLMASYSTTATELERLRLRASFLIGMRTAWSMSPKIISSGKPFVSLPNMI